MDGKIKRSRRSRSQRDRVRRKVAPDHVQNRSHSSGSDRGQSPFGNNKALRNDGKQTDLHPDRHPRPLRKKRRVLGCQEEDIIDGFAISSFLSLDNLELALRKRTKSLRPQQGQERWGRLGQQRPKPDKALALVNGFHVNSPDVETLPPPEEEKERGKMKVGSKKNKQGAQKSRSRAEVPKLGGLQQRSTSKDPHSETSFSGRGYSCDSESDVDDKVSGVDADKLFTLRITFESPAELQQTPEVSSTTSFTRVSGLQRSQEQSSDTPFTRPTPSPTPRPPGIPAPLCTPPSLPVCVKKERSSPKASTPLQTLPGLAQIKREPQVPFSHPQALFSGLHSSSLEGSRKRPHPRSPHLVRHSSPSPALPLAISELPAPHYFLAGPGHQRTPAAMFPSPLSLPNNGISGNPNGRGFSEHDLLRQELNNRFLAQSAERGGGPIPGPLKAEYHQHTHQHQHQHQHTFTPYPPCGPPPGILSAPSAPTMARTANLNLFPPYPPGTAGMPALLPHTAPFSSLQGAFQPKANPLNVVLRPEEITPPRISDPYRASSRNPGKWCAMHGQVAWQIHHQQQRMRHMRFDPGKTSVKLDLFSRPASAGLHPGMSYPQEMTRPLLPSSGLFPMSPFSSPYHHPHYLSTSHLPDPFSRPSTYGGFGNMPSNAFGGLGAPSSSPYGERQGHGLPGFAAPPHNGWNRLHRTPPSFPTPPTLSRPADSERKPTGMNSEPQEAKKRDLTATGEESGGDSRSSHERKSQPNQSSFTSYQISNLIGGNNSDKKKSSLEQGPQAERVTKPLGKVQIKQSSSPGPEVQSRRPPDPTMTPTVKHQSPCEAMPPLRGSVNIKQERREEFMAGSNMTLLLPSVPSISAHPHSQVPHPSRRNSYPNSGMFQGSHLPHSLPLSMGPLHSISSLSALERARVQPFMEARERVHLPPQWDPLRDPLRDPYRGLYLQSQQPQLTFDPARGHRQREAQHHIQDRHRQAEERARLHQLQGSPMEGHLAHTPTFMSSLGGAVYPRLSPSAPHSGHLNRTPPTATLSAPPPPPPPPLVSTATPTVGGRPATPRKTTPTSGTPASGDLAPSCAANQVEAQ